MEVGVRVETEHVQTGQRTFVAHAYLTFVAIKIQDQAASGGQTVTARVPQLKIMTARERWRAEQAEETANESSRSHKHRGRLLREGVARQNPRGDARKDCWHYFRAK